MGCGHYPSWLGYAYLQLGQRDKARNALNICREALQAETTMDHGHSMDPDQSVSGSFANMRLRYLLDTGDWDGEIAAWKLPPGSGPAARLDDTFARVMGEISRRHVAGAREALSELESVGREVSDIAARSALPDPTYGTRPQIMLLEARGLIAEQEGDLAGAERWLNEAARLEEKLPIAFGPPTIEKPTRELLGEFLRRRGKDREARVEFEKALARTPGRRLTRQGFEATAKNGGGL
jgi:hypothetical protein